MKAVAVALGLAVLGAGFGLAGCAGQPAASPVATVTAPASSATPSAPATTKTVTKVATVSAAPTTATATAPSAHAPAAAPPGGPDVTDPWAVVSAYYGDIDSGAYAQAYALIGNGAVTGQSYQQFAAGFACTGGQVVSENWESGDQVNFDLTATDSCSGTTDYYTGTDTVQNGTITAADIQQTG